MVNHPAITVIKRDIVFKPHSAVQVGVVVTGHVQALTLNDSTGIIITITVNIFSAVAKRCAAELRRSNCCKRYCPSKNFDRLIGINALSRRDDDSALRTAGPPRRIGNNIILYQNIVRVVKADPRAWRVVDIAIANDDMVDEPPGKNTSAFVIILFAPTMFMGPIIVNVFIGTSISKPSITMKLAPLLISIPPEPSNRRSGLVSLPSDTQRWLSNYRVRLRGH